MEEKLIQTLKDIASLSLRALDEAKQAALKVRQQFRLLQFEGVNNMAKKKKLPPCVREFRPGYFQGRKTVNGATVTVYGQTPEQAAERLTAALQAEKQRQTDEPHILDIDPVRVTYGEYLQIWRDTYKLPKLAASSLYQIDNVIKTHVPPWLKALPLSKLTALLLQRALNEVTSDRMREYTYTVYSDSLGWAYDLEYISDIMRNVPAVKSERHTGRAMTVAQQDDFLKITNGLEDIRLGKLFQFYLLTGARPGEAVLITTADFDYTLDQIHIPGTKNKYSDRYLWFSPALHELVDGWLPIDDVRVFPFTAHYIAQLMPDLFPGFTPKDLRHTFATRCKECGIPTDVYKQWLGHSKKSTVAETTYTHYETILQTEARKFTLHPNSVAKSVAKSDIEQNNDKND